MEKILWIIFVLNVSIPSFAQQVTVKEDETSVTLSNNIITLSFRKGNADLYAITYKGKSLLNGKDQRAYLLGPGFSMYPAICKITRQTDELVEISFYHEAGNHFQYDLRYVLMNNLPGIYCYLVQSHHAKDSAGDYGQTRWGLRSDEALFDYHLVRDSIQGPMPAMAELKEEIQDWTYKLADGTVYTKYNYADYIDGRYVHGMAGRKSGLGMFVIQASHEYLNGGPTKQFQNVHSNPYLINMFNCGHFLSDKRKGDNIIKDEWTKVDGPFLLYLNEGKDIASIWNDAKLKAEQEKKQWPYPWMQHGEYPLQRGIVKGILTVDGRPAANTQVILAQPGFDWQAQTRDYIFAVHTTADGSFTINNIRQGNYSLYAYGANSTEEFQQDRITVSANKTNDLKLVNWHTSRQGGLLWQIGIADRKTTGFRLSEGKRDYHLFKQPPADLKYSVEKNEAKDWYYAQTKKGSWDISFNLDKALNGQSMLTIGIAGSAKNPTLEVWVNGTKAGAYRFGNDASVYRSAVAGGYYYRQLVPFSSSLLKAGENQVSFKLPDVKDGGGIMYDVIKLEAN
ncbi:MAG: hypothetical protein H7Z13_14100 [Ferruginibacter sp.]|nr:hypothetical protein [Ferruginibacter sp.]